MRRMQLNAFCTALTPMQNLNNKLATVVFIEIPITGNARGNLLVCDYQEEKDVE